ncbi:hypothetical protein Q5X48_18835, partial [Acinetobacter baumannii]|nr:hypothetical protein [Acinetobacter baumannii]
IEVTVNPKGTITGKTTDVAPGSKVIVAIEGVDKDGKPVKANVETTVKPDGSYEVQVPAGIVDGSPVTAKATTTDRNGNKITDTDTLAGPVSDDPK